ncbi:unnamed protein product, partial [Brachionus calyciflorus]
IQKLVIDPFTPLENQEIKVAALNCKRECLIGMDIIKRMPNLNEHFSRIKETICTFSRINELETESSDIFLSQSANELNDKNKILEFVILKELDKVAAENFLDLKPNNVFQHRIVLKDPKTKPIKQKVRNVPFHLREKFKAVIDEQIAAKLIEPSNSPWSSPINIVGKKDGGIRITQDYRKLNELTVKDAYPLPKIDQLLTMLSKSRYFTKIDCFSGFYQILMCQASKELTAFACEFGLFHFNVMPMGLTNAPGTFQRTMNEIFKDLIEKNIVLVFLDDLLVQSADEETHLKNVKEIIRRLENYRLKIKLMKCIALANDEKIAAIKNFKLPETMDKLQSFMGLCGFYRKFIKSYASIAKPIYQLMVTKDFYIIPFKKAKKVKRENNTNKIKPKIIKVEWNLTATKAFETLKAALSSENVLTIPNFDKEFILVAYACDVAYGAVLGQEVMARLSQLRILANK